MPETRSIVIEPIWRSNIGIRERVHGPTVIEEAHTTTVLLPGDVAELLEDGTLSVRIPE